MSPEPRSGIEILKSVLDVEQVKLLPEDDRVKLGNFLQNYSSTRSEIYKHQAGIGINSGWNYASLQDHSSKIRKNINSMQDDLPAFELQLENFFKELVAD